MMDRKVGIGINEGKWVTMKRANFTNSRFWGGGNYGVRKRQVRDADPSGWRRVWGLRNAGPKSGGFG